MPPRSYHESLTPLQRLLLIRAVRLDRLMAATVQYISHCLGAKYTEAAPMHLSEVWSESEPRTPILFILSGSADPTADIEALARKSKVVMPPPISMGQGQEVPAVNQISACAAEGGWVLLQNCHLGLHCLRSVQHLVLDTVEIHDDFRLWLTTAPAADFPINLLQNSIKITTEVPTGLKEGLRRSFAWLNIDTVELVSTLHWRPLLFTICFLHTTLQERCKFGPLGWNVPYEFNQADLSASVQFLGNYLSSDAGSGGKLSWPSIRYMICEVMYGGRVTDDFDRSLLRTYGELWLDPRMSDGEFIFADGYVLPDLKTIDDYRNYAEVGLPAKVSPEVYGLHANAEFKYWQDRASGLLASILTLQPRDSGLDAETPAEEVVQQCCVELSQQLPPDFLPQELKNGEPKGPSAHSDTGGLRPVNIAFKQELQRMQKLITAVRETLAGLQAALSGMAVMDNDLSSAFDMLFSLELPQPWRALSWPSNHGLTSWTVEFVRRNESLSVWLRQGRPRAFILGEFFNPRGLLTAMVQEVAQLHSWELDSVSMFTEVTSLTRDSIEAPPAEGMYVGGLTMEGGSFDVQQQCLVDCAVQNRTLRSEMPLVHVSAISAGGLTPDSRLYSCPVYQYASRQLQHHVFSVDLRSEDAVPDRWVLRGVALLCSTVG